MVGGRGGGGGGGRSLGLRVDAITKGVRFRVCSDSRQASFVLLYHYGMGVAKM